MKKTNPIFILLIFLFFSFQAIAAEELFAEKLSAILPKKIAKIQINKSNKTDVEKLLGKPSLVENSKFYYEIDGYKYALEVSFNQEKVNEIHYTFFKNRPLIKKLKFKINTNELVPFPSSGPASGRYFLYSKPDAELMLDPISKTLYSIRIKK